MDQFKTQQISDKVHDNILLCLSPDQYKTQEMCDKIVSEDSFKEVWYNKNLPIKLL